LGNASFIAELEAFVDRIRPSAMVNSLSQTLLKLTAPGIPDFYQGTELWDFSLVDPDNRRPVDYALRRRLLREVQCGRVEEVVRRADEGLSKLWVIQRTLAARRTHPECFGPKAAYEPIAVRGSRAEHVVAFMRGGGAITLVPRLVMGLAARWENTSISIPSGKWRNELTGEAFDGGRLDVASLTKKFPVCFLILEPIG
jgi:(1->4)-alpha-D-glucan 1-alpha-D-glucosylmutase